MGSEVEEMFTSKYLCLGTIMALWALWAPQGY